MGIWRLIRVLWSLKIVNSNSFIALGYTQRQREVAILLPMQ